MEDFIFQSRIYFKRSEFVQLYLFPGGVLPKTFSENFLKIHRKTLLLQESLFIMKLQSLKLCRVKSGSYWTLCLWIMLILQKTVFLLSKTKLITIFPTIYEETNALFSSSLNNSTRESNNHSCGGPWPWLNLLLARPLQSRVFRTLSNIMYI